MCESLLCRKSSSDTGCSFYWGVGAAEGTTCDSGKVSWNDIYSRNFNSIMFHDYLTSE